VTHSCVKYPVLYSLYMLDTTPTFLTVIISLSAVKTRRVGRWPIKLLHKFTI